jgi:hypothetical protein
MEDDMRSNERHGPGPGLLLLIPIGLLIAKGIGRRRRMLEAGHGAGRHHRFAHGFASGGFGPGGFDAEGRYTFALPPKLERVLDDWHDRVHAANESRPDGATTDTATA